MVNAVKKKQQSDLKSPKDEVVPFDKYIMDGQLRMPVSLMSYPGNEDVLDSLIVNGREGEFALYDLNKETGELRLPRSQKLHVPPMVFFTDHTSVGRFIDYPSFFKPREGQEEAIFSCIKNLRETNGSLLIARCGTGKTWMSVEIALRMHRSVCVLVHKEFLAQQWEEAFKAISPNILVGRMQRDIVDTGRTHDVVIAVTQSVVNPKRDYPQEFFDSFGLIICDEVHRYAASLWQGAITRFPAKYRLGVTATPERSDGLWPVISRHISPRGPILQAESLKPDIYTIKLQTPMPRELVDDAYMKVVKPWADEKMKRALTISYLGENKERTSTILQYLLKAYHKGRKIIVISERRCQLNDFASMLKANGVTDEEFGFYVGGMKQEKLDIAADRSIILSTYQMVKEGLNIPGLDTLIMATPQAHVEQTVGRILRVCEGKRSPMVLDFVDSTSPLLMGMGYSRIKQYRKLCYTVHP
jgi:superfamily II DNA or RNA helicase